MRQEAGYGAEEFKKKWNEETDGDGGLTGAYDSDVRSQMLDAEGVAAEVLFPDADVLGTGRLASSPFGSGLGSSEGNDPELVLAGAKAHNRWLADFWPSRPTVGWGWRWCPSCTTSTRPWPRSTPSAELGLGGVMMPTRWMTEPAYHDPRYEPVWSAIEELGLVLHTHSGSGPADYDPGPGFMAIYATEAWWWAARPLWVLLWSGVFERHPDLRYVIAENGAWWLPDLVTKMDEKYVGGPQHGQAGQRLPREPVHEAQRVHRPQLLPGRLHPRRGGHRPALPGRGGQRAVGQRLPPSRGHLSPHPRDGPPALQGPARRRRRAGCSG